MDNNNDADLNGEIVLDSENADNNPSDTLSTDTDDSTALDSSQPTESKPTKLKTPTMFSSLCYYPKGVKFASQEKDEEIILLIRRDFITNVPWIFIAVIALIVPIAISPFSQFLLPPSLSTQTIALIMGFYYLVLFGMIVLRFALWFYHVSYLTNLRIIDFDVHGILLRDVAETRLKLVQDVSYSQTGFFQSLFNYGDVSVQTAATIQNIEFDKAPDPARIARIIGDKIGRRLR